MKIRNLVAFILIHLLLTACFKEDEKVIPHDPGDVELDSVRVALNDRYYYQVYYDLGRKEIVKTNLKADWDLGFECNPGGFKIILNSANFMVAANTGQTDFNALIDTTGYTWYFDASSGNPDTTAFGDWIDFTGLDSVKIYSNEIYVIDRGYDADGNLRGFRKIVFQEVTDSTFSFRYANLDGSDENTFTITKDPAVNYMCFSFDDGGEQLNLEPPKDLWDLVFTQYTTLLYTNEGDPYPYLLTGVLSNPAGVEVAQDTLYDFASINLEIAGSLIYSDAPDEIGYDWKDVVGDVTSGSVTYVIREGLHYVVRDPEGFYFKLRFFSFYNIQNGDKGVPTFEYQRL
jgi:hypothetical protein